VQSAFETIRPPALFLFEPHQPELCNFTPTTFVDITSVIEQKREAMGHMKAQKYLQTYYAQRAEHRANHARRASGNQDVRFAEAFMRVIPQVVSVL
jgi:4-oxalomesaconate hydratase